jgi:hypothetical protein
MIPDLGIDPDMAERSEEYAMTYLQPSQETDLVRLNSKLLTVVLSPFASLLSRRMALFSIAFLISHEFAHILEFRSIRKKQFMINEESYLSPLGITCMEVGTVWEIRTCGAKITNTCFASEDLLTAFGFCARSSA